jgi:Domain of unknown function (DUF1707)
VVYGPGQAYPPQPAQSAMGTAAATVNPSWLAATADRERTVGILRAGFTEGRLGQDELDERVAQAYAARTYASLWALTADLPAGPYPVPHAFGYGPQVVAPPGAVVAPDGTEASSWQSAAALLITALVIFTLAALVTAIVTAHVQPGLVSSTSVSPDQPPGVIQPFQRVHLAPYVKPMIAPAVQKP